MTEWLAILIFGGPIMLWWGISLYHAWVGNTYKHSIHATSTTSTAFAEAKQRWTKDMAKDKEGS